MKGATPPRSSSMVNVRICRSDRSFTFSYSFSSLGNSALQGPHQVAQTLIRTVRPSRFLRRQVLPERSASSNAGMAFVGFFHPLSANSWILAAGGVLQRFQAV